MDFNIGNAFMVILIIGICAGVAITYFISVFGLFFLLKCVFYVILFGMFLSLCGMCFEYVQEKRGKR